MLGQHTEFYPSTQSIARAFVKICETYRYSTPSRSSKKSFRIIDPSAGNGVLLDALKASWSFNSATPNNRNPSNTSTFSAIEIDPDLRAILQVKGYSLIDRDWLQYREPTSFDIIVVNPPFSDGIHHILKAWDYLADEGLLVSVVPNAMLDEGNSYKSKLSALIAQFGTVEDIGDAFRDGLRRTGVLCSIVTLTKPKGKSKNWFEGLDVEQDNFDIGEDFCVNPLAHPNQIETLVRQYEIVCKCAIDRNKSQQQLDYFLRGISRPVMDSTNRNNDDDFKCVNDLETQLRIIKSRFWNTLFQKTKIAQKTTSAFQKKFQEGALEITNMAFNKSNILEILSIFFENRSEIMQDCIKDVFDTCTKYHANNTNHSEGWKSNRTSKVADRLIIPSLRLYEYDSWTWIHSGDRFGTFADDFDKVLCWVTGVNQADDRFKGLLKTINDKLHVLRSTKWDTSIPSAYGDELISTFFRIKIFKKGTIHLKFIDNKVRDAFNLAAAKGTKTIGADY
jgi:Domain of unknown function (DUF4942)/Methyltransferase small domain